MQLVSVRIWTRVAVSIYYDGNHYTTGTNNCVNTFEGDKPREDVDKAIN